MIRIELKRNSAGTVKRAEIDGELPRLLALLLQQLILRVGPQ